MASNRRSKTVDAAVRRGWAILANKAFGVAKNQAERGLLGAAEGTMTTVEGFLDRAGANATRWYF